MCPWPLDVNCSDYKNKMENAILETESFFNLSLETTNKIHTTRNAYINEVVQIEKNLKSEEEENYVNEANYRVIDFWTVADEKWRGRNWYPTMYKKIIKHLPLFWDNSNLM